MESACSHYGVSVRTSGCSADSGGASDMLNASTADCLVTDAARSWIAMRKIMFAHCAHFAFEVSDYDAAVR